MLAAVPMPLCTITAPKRIPLNLHLTKQQIVIPAGTSQKDIQLSGDEVGVVEHTIAQIHRENNVPEKEFGGISCPEREESDAHPPIGSKKHRALHPEEYEEGGKHGPKKPSKAEEKAQAKAEHKPHEKAK